MQLTFTVLFRVPAEGAAEYVAAVEAKQIAKQNALTEQNNIARQEAIKQQTIIWGVLPDSVVPFLDANQLMGTGSTTSTTVGQ